MMLKNIYIATLVVFITIFSSISFSVTMPPAPPPVPVVEPNFPQTVLTPAEAAQKKQQEELEYKRSNQKLNNSKSIVPTKQPGVYNDNHGFYFGLYANFMSQESNMELSLDAYQPFQSGMVFDASQASGCRPSVNEPDRCSGKDMKYIDETNRTLLNSSIVSNSKVLFTPTLGYKYRPLGIRAELGLAINPQAYSSSTVESQSFDYLAYACKDNSCGGGYDQGTNQPIKPPNTNWPDAPNNNPVSQSPVFATETNYSLTTNVNYAISYVNNLSATFYKDFESLTYLNITPYVSVGVTYFLPKRVDSTYNYYLSADYCAPSTDISTENNCTKLPVTQPGIDPPFKPNTPTGSEDWSCANINGGTNPQERCSNEWGKKDLTYNSNVTYSYTIPGQFVPSFKIGLSYTQVKDYAVVWDLSYGAYWYSSSDTININYSNYNYSYSTANGGADSKIGQELEKNITGYNNPNNLPATLKIEDKMIQEISLGVRVYFR